MQRQHSSNSNESIASFDEELDIPVKRKGLLPPIKIDANLPGGINFSVTPEMPLKSAKSSFILSSPSPTSLSSSQGSVDESLAGALTPSQDWLEAVKNSHKSFADEDLDKDWLGLCLSALLQPDFLAKFDFDCSENAVKILLKDIIFLQRLKDVSSS